MSAPRPPIKPVLVSGAVVRWIDHVTYPPDHPPYWLTTPVRIIRDGAEEIEVAGVRYKQQKLTIEERNLDACRFCCARFDDRLCNVISPYCEQGYVFVKINRERKC